VSNRQVDAGHQESIGSQPDVPYTFSAIRPSGRAACAAASAVAWLIEITSPPVSTTKFA
jgi:hypothetical protein